MNLDDKNTYTILAVDDDPTNINVIISHLHPLKAKMLIANSGSAALEVLERTLPNLIILDINMPGMSGIEVCRTIKKDERFNNIPILFLTGSEKDISEAFAAGGVDYILKPVRSEELLARVHTHIKLSELVLSLDRANLLLESINESLEIKVQQRTIELVTSNKNLRKEIDERRRLQDKLSYLSHHDFVTRMFNRNSMELELKTVMDKPTKNGSHWFLVFIDLDQFKVINDTCGHVAGDELLRQFADLLKGIFTFDNICARMGGDEFAILFELPDLAAAIKQTTILKESLELIKFEWNDEIFKHTVSIAIVEVDESIDSVSHLLSIAERTCFESKRKGGGEISIYNYTKQHIDKTHQQMRIIPLIHEAIEKDHFVLHFQYIENTDGSVSNKAEVLIRLKGADNKLKSPGHFIPVAERFHLITEIDKWVIRNVCKRIPSLSNDIILSINLSGEFIVKSNAPQVIQNYLNEYDVDPHRLCFEITESSAISNIEATQYLIAELKPLGCQFSLDDFGTGTSSYEYLKQLSIDFVKIDGMFVRDIENDIINQRMVESIAGIAKAKNISVIAECVETKEALHLLGNMHINFYQGFVTHTPESLDLLIKTLD